jgi:hypothetical protein
VCYLVHKREIVDEPIPDDCHAEPAADYDGAGMNWGFADNMKRASAAQCCEHCKQYPADDKGRKCELWHSPAFLTLE